MEPYRPKTLPLLATDPGTGLSSTAKEPPGKTSMSDYLPRKPNETCATALLQLAPRT